MDRLSEGDEESWVLSYVEIMLAGLRGGLQQLDMAGGTPKRLQRCCGGSVLFAPLGHNAEESTTELLQVKRGTEKSPR